MFGDACVAGVLPKSAGAADPLDHAPPADRSPRRDAGTRHPPPGGQRHRPVPLRLGLRSSCGMPALVAAGGSGASAQTCTFVVRPVRTGAALIRRDLASVTRLHPVGGTVLRLNGAAPGARRFPIRPENPAMARSVISSRSAVGSPAARPTSQAGPEAPRCAPPGGAGSRRSPASRHSREVRS